MLAPLVNKKTLPQNVCALFRSLSVLAALEKVTLQILYF